MPVEYDIEYKGLDEQLRKLEGFDRIYRRHMTNALKEGTKEVQKRWIRIAPIDTGAYRRSIAHNREIRKMTGGEIVGRVWTDLEYPIYLETMDRYHYRRTARKGQRTRGHVKEAAKEASKLVMKLLERATKRIVKDLEVK